MPEQSLLPPNATRLERAVADMAQRITELPVLIQSLHRIAECPVPFLPWLAWAHRIDYWDPEWSEAQKRTVISGARSFNQQRGTRSAIQQLLAQMLPSLTPELQAWYQQQPPGMPYTFVVSIPGTTISATDLHTIQLAVDSTKSARDGYAIAARVRTTSTTYSAGATSFGSIATLTT